MLDSSRAHEIKERLLADIENGKYAEGAKLPSERELVERFRASRDTVRRAIKELEAQGIVLRQGTSGSYVAKSALWDEGRRLREALDGLGLLVKLQEQLEAEQRFVDGFTPLGRPEKSWKVLHAEPLAIMAASEDVAADLKVPKNAFVLRRFRVLGGEDRTPVRIIESFYPGSQFIDLLKEGLDPEGLQDWLAANYESRAQRIVEGMKVRLPLGLEHQFLRISRVAAVVDITRQVLDEDDQVMEVSYLVTPASLFRFHYEYRPRPETDRHVPNDTAETLPLKG